MNFDSTLLETYRTLLQTTDLQNAYQEFIRLFRFLRCLLFLYRPWFERKGSKTGCGFRPQELPTGGVALRSQPNCSVPLG